MSLRDFSDREISELRRLIRTSRTPEQKNLQPSLQAEVNIYVSEDGIDAVETNDDDDQEVGVGQGTIQDLNPDPANVKDPIVGDTNQQERDLYNVGGAIPANTPFIAVRDTHGNLLTISTTSIVEVITTETVTPATNPLDGWTESKASILSRDTIGDLTDTGNSIDVRNHSRDANAPSGVYGQVTSIAGRYVWVWLDCTGAGSGSASGTPAGSGAPPGSGSIGI